MRKTRQQSFRNCAERAMSQAAKALLQLGRSADRYRGHYTPGDANAIVQRLKAELAILEGKLTVEEAAQSRFSWPS